MALRVTLSDRQGPAAREVPALMPSTPGELMSFVLPLVWDCTSMRRLALGNDVAEGRVDGGPGHHPHVPSKRAVPAEHGGTGPHRNPVEKFLPPQGNPPPAHRPSGPEPPCREHGAFGDEDGTIIAPAVERLGAIHPDAEFDGPSVPDCVYRDAVEGNYDAVLAPYHDQGLIPLKLVDFHTAVNVTLGLPRPRLSPDHGTAFNLAGAGKANPSSTIHAFQLAVRMAQTR